MKELSLNILDIAENSVKAGATLVTVLVMARGNVLTVEIDDNGCGMDEEFLKRVTDPFTTTRTFCTLGAQVVWLLRSEWLTLLPDMVPLAQTSQNFPISYTSFWSGNNRITKLFYHFFLRLTRAFCKPL